jgi:hypothetical protein
LIVPNVPLMPAAVTGPRTGGQMCAQVPTHFDVVEVSGENAYSVKPLALVSTVALPISAVFTLSAAAAAGLPPPAEEAAEGVLGEPHAASATAAAAATGRTSSIRRRIRLRTVRSALSLLPESRIIRVVMTGLLVSGLLGSRTPIPL